MAMDVSVRVDAVEDRIQRGGTAADAAVRPSVRGVFRQRSAVDAGGL